MKIPSRICHLLVKVVEFLGEFHIACRFLHTLIFFLIKNPNINFL